MVEFIVLEFLVVGGELKVFFVVDFLVDDLLEVGYFVFDDAGDELLVGFEEGLEEGLGVEEWILF